MLAVAMGFTACTSDDDVTSTPDTPKQITVYATTEQPSATRTSLSEGNETDGYEVLWSEGDQIKFGVSDDYVFTLKSGAGTTTGVFEGTAPNDGDSYMVVYPANFNGKIPTEQTYVENNIPQGLPMRASKVSVKHVDDEVVISPISFKNVGGILRLNLKGEAKVTSITISATNLTNPITLSCGTGVQLNTTTATPFHIAVPGADDPGTAYSGLKIVITDDAGKVCTKTLKSDKTITVQRSMITDITLTANNFAFPFGQGEAAATGIGNVKWIQLWENGPKFAEYNIGATSATEYGGYYTWGGTYKNGKDIEWTADQNTGTSKLSGDTDTATKLWGSNWRMPTNDELGIKDEDAIDESFTGGILYECTCTWVTNYNGTGVKGLLCTGKGDYSSNSIFLPGAGFLEYSVGVITGYGVTEQCVYWTSMPDDDNAYSMTFYDDNYAYVSGDGCRYQGYSVRAVLAE